MKEEIKALPNSQKVLSIIMELENEERNEQRKEEMKWERHRRYTGRIREFLNNFGIFDWEYTDSNLWLKFEGAFWEQRQLCMNMGLNHFETYEEDVEMLEADMSWEYFRTIMHLWENEYKNNLGGKNQPDEDLTTLTEWMREDVRI